MGLARPIHTPDGVDVTPGHEVIITPPKPVDYERRESIPNIAGVIEPERRQYIPYLITNGVGMGLGVDARLLQCFPEINLQTFAPDQDATKKKAKREGEDGPPRLDITGKAHKLQYYNNFPVHHVIGYPTDDPALKRVKVADFFSKPQFHRQLRAWQRSFLRPENIIHFNLIQEAGGNAFRINWGLDAFVDEGIIDTVLATWKASAAEQAAAIPVRTEQYFKPIDQTRESMLEDFKLIREGRAFHAKLVAGGMDPLDAVKQMRENRAKSGDPCVSEKPKAKA